MRPRLGTLILATLFVVVQTQLWFGRGSLSQVHQLKIELDTQIQRNEQADAQNEQLAAEIRDLKEGLDMVEEKARMELGMVKDNEIYVHINRKGLQ
jgi:cell division protein FtsB